MAGRTFRLERTQFLPRPLPEVFAFFSDAGNLERITPGFLRFRILTPRPIPMHEGALIDYRLSLFGVPLRWRSRIDLWEPGVRFVDSQVTGPYRTWVHLHEFRAVPGGTLVTDRVDYEVPLGPLGTLARALFVRRSLERIFDHRAEAVGGLLGGRPGPETRAAPGPGI
ncbi:MAG: SRPBCC family protein [Planctomycetaceae bacterium]|nr:SRPBCC family protein [Planctomycetota bacterium]NUN53849.1 SRPBCC family protein [Planctomycetaceae bacterium]